MTLLDRAHLALDYLAARRFDRMRNRAALEQHQARRLAVLLEQVAATSPFYAAYRGLPLAQWPIVEKATWLRHFDAINTAGLTLTEVRGAADAAEASRDFRSTLRGITVGFSTGTSGSRGVYVASSRERARWAGTLIAKVLRAGLFARERIALLLRAGSTLYDTVGALRIEFRFFDLARPWRVVVDELAAFSPTILVAPAQVLALLSAEGRATRPAPRRVISVAEVLDDLDRRRIEAAFGIAVEQIYQATEGFLGVTCERGTLHLNEDLVVFEREWQDAERTRFVPLVTDLFRTTQPVIRYRLNDILSVRASPCPCGRATLALGAVEGRMDDVLWLAATSDGATVPVFPDLLSRTILRSLPGLEDYDVVEIAPGRWQVGLAPAATARDSERLCTELAMLATRLGAQAPRVETVAVPERTLLGKQRRVRGLPKAPCAS